MLQTSAKFALFQFLSLLTLAGVFGAIVAEATVPKGEGQRTLPQLELATTIAQPPVLEVSDTASFNASSVDVLTTPVMKPFVTEVSPLAANSIERFTTTTAKTIASDIAFLPFQLAQSTATAPIMASRSAADLGEVLVADPQVLSTRENPLVADRAPATTTPPLAKPCPPSLTPNLPVLRHVKKPRGNRLLQTEVNPNLGLRCKDTSEQFWTRDFLLGNWGGLRDRLFDQGYEFTLINFNDFYGNPSGGRRQGFAYNGVTVYGIDIFTSKTGWWPNGQFHVTGVFVGRTAALRKDFVGAFNSLYAIEPLVDGLKLTENWYGQKFDNGRIEIRIGQIFPFIRIAQTMSSGIFTNPSFQYPAFLGRTPGDGLANSFAAPPFGIQAFYNATPQLTLAAHIFDGFTSPGGGRDNIANTSIVLTPEDGAEGILELSYKLNQEPGTTKLPGNYRLGAQFHTGRFLDNTVAIDGKLRALTEAARQPVYGNYGFYAKAEQMLLSESKEFPGITQGLTAFVQGQVAPLGDRNTVSFNVATGLDYEGLFEGRDHDVLGLGVSYTRFSSGIREYDRTLRSIDPTYSVRDGEMVVELLYLAEIAPWWVVIGSLQHIIHPNGSSDIPNATVLGISTRFAF